LKSVVSNKSTRPHGAAIYARHWTAEQRPQSIEDQIEIYRPLLPMKPVPMGA
jgi:hypothetical protein